MKMWLCQSKGGIWSKRVDTLQFFFVAGVYTLVIILVKDGEQ